MSPAASKPDVKLALVIDDSVIQRKVLSVLLKEEGYRVLTASDGAQGVAMYIQYQPDLVLMDINIPVMNGYEAAKKIKKLSPNTLCPLIFITGMDTDQAYIDSINAGGDGILVRPFSPQVFKAKIKSIQRISDMYSEIKTLHQEQQQDAETAEKLMSGVIESRNYALDKISIVKQATALFSGDIQLTALCPNGDVNILLGDFTGHGLRSTIGAIPLSETFRAMTKKGFGLIELIAQVNRQLAHLLPTDLFLCAIFVTVSAHEKSVYVFNAGLPDGYVFGSEGEIKHQFSSSHPPLGILPQLIENPKITIVPISFDDRVVLISDGIIEASNEAGELFGVARFELAATQGIIAKSVSRVVMKSIGEFCAGKAQDDDVSLIDIPCGGWQERINLNKNVLTMGSSSYQDAYLQSIPTWQWSLKLTGKPLASVNPIPMIMNQINDIEGEGEHWKTLYTILTELFSNALEHGVLGLSSQLKNSAEGFSQYYEAKESLLKNLQTGFINIALNYYSLSAGGKMDIIFKDSGDGFDCSEFCKNNLASTDNQQVLSGRGIKLVEHLSDTLEYQESGSLVKAVYIWQNKSD